MFSVSLPALGSGNRFRHFHGTENTLLIYTLPRTQWTCPAWTSLSCWEKSFWIIFSKREGKVTCRDQQPLRPLIAILWALPHEIVSTSGWSFLKLSVLLCCIIQSKVAQFSIFCTHRHGTWFFASLRYMMSSLCGDTCPITLIQPYLHQSLLILCYLDVRRPILPFNSNL